jgi:hypothetical protein
LRCTLEAIQDGLQPLNRTGVDALHEETLFLQGLIGELQDLALAEAGRLDLHFRGGRYQIDRETFVVWLPTTALIVDDVD